MAEKRERLASPAERTRAVLAEFQAMAVPSLAGAATFSIVQPVIPRAPHIPILYVVA